MKKVLIFLLLLSFSFCFSQIDWYKSKIKSDSAISYYEKFQKAQLTSEKINFIDQSIKFEPNNFFLHMMKSQLYHIDGDFVKYENFLNSIIIKFPNQGEPYYTLGFFDEDRGKIESPNQNFEIALVRFNEADIDSEDFDQNFLKMLTLLLLKKKVKQRKYLMNFH